MGQQELHMEGGARLEDYEILLMVLYRNDTRMFGRSSEVREGWGIFLSIITFADESHLHQRTLIVPGYRSSGHVQKL